MLSIQYDSLAQALTKVIIQFPDRREWSACTKNDSAHRMSSTAILRFRGIFVMWSWVFIALITTPSAELSAEGFTSLNSQTHHLKEIGEELNVNAVYQRFVNRELERTDTLSLGFDDATHWFVTNVSNSTEQSAWILEFEYPLLDSIDVYVIRSSGQIEASQIGDRRPFSERYFPTRFLHLPFTLEQDESITLLWRIKTQTSLIAGARIAPHDLWLPARSVESDLRIFVYGILFAIAVFLVTLSVWTGTTGPLYVGLSAAFVLVAILNLEGLGSRFLAFLPIDIRKVLTLVSLSLIGASMLMLLSALFNLKNLAPRRNGLLLNSSIGFLSVAVITIIVGYKIAKLYPLLMLIMAVIFLETLFWANRQKLRAAYVSNAALALIILPPIFNSQRYSGVLENYPLFDNANAIGFSLGFLAFSLAIADQMLLQRRERKAMQDDIQAAHSALESIEKTKVQLEAQNLLLNQEMKDAAQKLTDADQMATLGTMMTGIIHDMNNPLQFISDLDQSYETRHRELKALLDSLLGDAEGPEADNLREVIENHFSDLSRSTADLKLGTTKLKALSKAMRNSARRDPSPAHHALRPIVDECITIIGSKLKLHTLTCDVPEDLMIYVTRSQLSQILINLISNARDATQERYDQQPGVDYHPWIQITAQERPLHARDGIVLLVEDNGTGISAEITEKIFESFFTTKEVGLGTGLGLSIIRRLVENHGGTITIGESSLGGARFELFFPLPKPEEDLAEVTPLPDAPSPSKIV